MKFLNNPSDIYHIIDINTSDSDLIDFLCNEFGNANINIEQNCELTELQNMVNLKTFGIDVLNKTVIRYNRYLAEIETWEIHEKCCLYIKETIILFLNESSKDVSNQNIVYRLQLMKYIDSEIMNSLQNM